MDRKSFIKSVAAGGVFAALSPLSVAECGEKNPPFAKFDMQKRVFEVGKNYSVAVKFPEKLRGKVEGGFLSVLGDDGASDVNGDFFNKPVGTPIPFKISDGAMRFDIKFGREQGYCIRLFDGKIPPETEAHKMPRPIAVLHVYALERDLLSLVPLRGDFHIHSTRSDGRNKPEEVALRCYECGFDFQSISDHGRYQPSVDMQKLFSEYDTSMAFYNAEECHMAYPHIHSLGATQSVSDYIYANIPWYYRRVDVIMKDIPETFPLRVRKDIAKIQAECEVIRKFGGLAVYNHPYWQKDLMGVQYYNQSPKSIWDEVCRRKIFDVYEFVNYGCGDMSIARAACNYAELRARGLHYPVIGNSDAHRVEDQGSSYTVVFAKSNSIEDVKAAIMARRSVAVAEFEYTDKTQRDFGRPARFAFGEDRFVRFAYFLFGHYFPEHGKAVAAEGRVLRDIILGKKQSEENAAKLEKLAAVSRNSYAEFRA